MKLGDLNNDSQVNITDIVTLVDIVLNGYTPFSVSPDSINLPSGGRATISIAGGYSFYEVVSADTDVVEASLFGTTIMLEAIGGGETIVTVKDVLTFRSIDIPVIVEYNSLQVSTNELYMVVGEQSTVNITSGSGSYSVQNSDDDVAIVNVSEDEVTVKAISIGTTTIIVTDEKSGQTTMIEVIVNYFPLTLSSSTLDLSIGDEETISIISGNGDYSVSSSDTNVATATLDDGSVVVTAVGGGTATITVKDISSGKTADITVTVEFFPLTLSEYSLQLSPGNEGTVSITSGNGSFTLKSSNTDVAIAKLVGFSVKITAMNTGFAIITITDTKSGQTATIEVLVSSCPDGNHPHMIDLGLPSGTLWACCNVGADNPEEYGGYYAFGETEEKDVYNEVTYLYSTGYDSNGDGFYDRNVHYQNLGTNICGTEYDVAHVKWGGTWEMPSYNHYDELINNCSLEVITIDSIKGIMLLSNYNGKSIFIPYAGYRESSRIIGAGTISFSYLGTNLNLQESQQGRYALYCAFVGSSELYYPELYYNVLKHSCFGYSVRPVCPNYTLKLFMTNVKVPIGKSVTVDIASGSGNYNVKSNDENVATAVIDENSIIITGISCNTTTLIVTDEKNGQTAIIEVAVNAEQLDLLACPDSNHPHKIDLGLPSDTKWACCNVGATSPEGNGGMYAWGEKQEKDNYDINNYLYCKDKTRGICYNIGEDIAGTRYDVAYVKWGNDWQMPTKEQIDELKNNCAYIWTTVNGINGKLFISSNDRTIFLPAAWSNYTRGAYWSSTLYAPKTDSRYYYAYHLFIDSKSTYKIGYNKGARYGGRMVRPVSR